MLSWFKGNNNSKYRERLLLAFPQALKTDMEKVLDILPLDINYIVLSDGKVHKVDDLIHHNTTTVLLDGELLTIPYRLYFNQPAPRKEHRLTDRQKTILNCIYLRHHNGFIRQSRLEKIQSNEYWVTPFTFQLLGEYVLEILEVLGRQLDEQKLENFKRFAIENPRYYLQTESLTDIARHKDAEHIDDIIKNWMRNRNTIELLGFWEMIYNTNFNPSNSTGLENNPV